MTAHTRTRRSGQSLTEGATWDDSLRWSLRPRILYYHGGISLRCAHSYLGKHGIQWSASRQALHVDMTTTEPSWRAGLEMPNREKYAPLMRRCLGGRRCPKRHLSIMVGGDTEAVKEVMPLRNFWGQTLLYQGGPGMGQHAKLSNQIVIAGTMIGVGESLLYGYKAGLDLDAMLRSVSSGAAACWTRATWRLAFFGGI